MFAHLSFNLQHTVHQNCNIQKQCNYSSIVTYKALETTAALQLQQRGKEH